MGDRVSISFRQKNDWYNNGKKEEHTDESPALFHHWGGTDFPKFAFDWFKALRKHLKKNQDDSIGTDPLTRMEPRNLMVQFISAIKDEEAFRLRNYKHKNKELIWSVDDNLLSYSIYLGKDGNDGDNSDNGHYTIDVDAGKMFDDKGQSIG